jgi:ElaB/YqjD/DUF883 family membrane-anchored ribosome-binding protein
MERQIEDLGADVRALLDATAEAADAKIIEARDRLVEAFDRGRSAWTYVQDRAGSGVAATRRSVHAHPWPWVGAALGAGAVLGLMFGRRH